MSSMTIDRIDLHQLAQLADFETTSESANFHVITFALSFIIS